jgi:hypothetical protein
MIISFIISEVRHMNAVVNVMLAEDVVRAKCERSGVLIDVTEPLPDGGTHLVCCTDAGAETMRLLFGKSMLVGFVRRSPVSGALGLGSIEA